MKAVLDYDLFAATFTLFDNIETRLTFNEADGTGTASDVYHPTERIGNKYYNHAWYKFTEENYRRAPRFIGSLRRQSHSIIREFAPADARLPSSDVIFTIAHFVQNEFGGFDIEAMATGDDRRRLLAQLYSPQEPNCIPPKDPVKLWNAMTDEERTKFYLFALRKISSFVIMPLEQDTFRPPPYFYRDDDLLAKGYIPIIDYTNSKVDFVWCKVPVIDQWSSEYLGVKQRVYCGDGTLRLSYLYTNTDDVFEFSSLPEIKPTTIKYVNQKLNVE